MKRYSNIIFSVFLFIFLLTLTVESQGCTIGFGRTMEFNGKTLKPVNKTQNQMMDMNNVKRVYFCLNKDTREDRLQFNSFSFDCRLDVPEGDKLKTLDFKLIASNKTGNDNDQIKNKMVYSNRKKKAEANRNTDQPLDYGLDYYKVKIVDINLFAMDIIYLSDEPCKVEFTHYFLPRQLNINSKTNRFEDSKKMTVFLFDRPEVNLDYNFDPKFEIDYDFLDLIKDKEVDIKPYSFTNTKPKLSEFLSQIEEQVKSTSINISNIMNQFNQFDITTFNSIKKHPTSNFRYRSPLLNYELISLNFNKKTKVTK